MDCTIPPVDMLKRSPWTWVPVLLAILAFATAWPGSFFVVDDGWLVEDNRLVREPSAKDLLAIFNPSAPRIELGLEYLPLRDLSYTVDAWIFRAGRRWLEIDWTLASVCHLTQSLLYGLDALLLALLVHQLTSRKVWAFLAAALFALHPVHAEAVCWISSRKDVLGTAFVLASALAWRRHWETGGGRQALLYLAAWLAYAAALMTKATMAVLPGLLLALDLFFPPSGQRWGWRTALRTLPLFLLFFPFQAIHVMNAMGGLVNAEFPGINRWTALPTVVQVGCRYLGFLLMLPLTRHTPYRNAWSEGWEAASLGSAAVLLCLACAAAWLGFQAWRGRLRPAWAATGLGLAWLGIAWLPVSNLVYMPQIMMADRYLFLPSAGFCLMAAVALEAWGRLRPWTVPVFLGAGLLVQDLHQGLRWRSSPPVFDHAFREDPRNEMAYAGLLKSLCSRQGPEAVYRHFRRAEVLADTPHQFEGILVYTWRTAAIARIDAGRPQEALEALDLAMVRTPNHIELLGMRAMACSALQKPAEAERDFRTRTRLAPWHAEAWLELGIFCNNQQRFPEARKALDHAQTLQPGNVRVLCTRGPVLLNLGAFDEAWACYEQAVRQVDRPGTGRRPLADFGMALAGAWTEARAKPAAASAALAARDPADVRTLVLRAQEVLGVVPETETLLALIDLAARDPVSAERHLRRSLALKADDPARLLLAELLRERGVQALLAKDPEAAFLDYREALALFPSGVDTRGVQTHLEMVSSEVLRRRFEKGTRAFRTGDLEGARRGFLSALEVAPDFFEGWFNLGLVQLRLKDWRAAAGAFGKASALEPGDFEAALRLGDALREAGDAAGAGQAFARAGTLAATEAQRKAVAVRLDMRLDSAP